MGYHLTGVLFGSSDSQKVNRQIVISPLEHESPPTAVTDSTQGDWLRNLSPGRFSGCRPLLGQPAGSVVCLTVPGAATQDSVREDTPGSSVAPAQVCAWL